MTVNLVVMGIVTAALIIGAYILGWQAGNSCEGDDDEG